MPFYLSSASNLVLLDCDWSVCWHSSPFSVKFFKYSQYFDSSLLSSRKLIKGVIGSWGSRYILQHVLGNSVKWWLPQDIESIPCVGTCKSDKCKKSFKKGKQKCFSKGKKTEIIINQTAQHIRSFMKGCKKFFFGSPTANLQFEILFLFIVAWWPRSTLKSRVSFRVVWGPRGLPQSLWGRGPGFPDLLLLTVARVKVSLSVTPYQHFSLAQVNRLLYCVSLHSQGGVGRGCIWFQWNNGIRLRTSRKRCASPGWLQELLYLLKILLGLWAVGENFQIATAYTRNCPPIPCLLFCLSHSPNLLLVLSEQCSPGVQNKNNAWPPAFPEGNSWKGQDVMVPWAFNWWIPLLTRNHLHIQLPTSP